MNKIVTLLVILFFPVLCMSQGKSKPGKYVERYDIPILRMSYDDGRRIIIGGTMRIWVDIEDGYNNIYLDFRDRNGEYVDSELFLDEIPPIVYHQTQDESIKLRGGGTGIASNLYEIQWGNQRYIFHLMKLPNGTSEYKVERLYVENGKQIRKPESFTCTLNKSCLLNIGRVFREAARRNAIRLIQRN